VPAAAVIPAPIAYIKVVAVKKLVVGCQDALCGLGRLALTSCFTGPPVPSSGFPFLLLS
jgi:predicted RNA methylase